MSRSSSALGGVLEHLVINAVDALGAAADFAHEFRRVQHFPQPTAYLLHVLFPLGAAGGQHPGNFPVAVFVQVAEGQVVQLPLDFPDAQAVGQGRVDVQGFLGDGLALGRGQGVEGFHIVETVGQLNQHHANVLGHSDQHLAEAFGIEPVRVIQGDEARWPRFPAAGSPYGLAW